jgi:hypothetical protein
LPGLGRPQAAGTTAETANRSLVPQLNVTQQPNEETGELTEKDLLGTMRNRGTPVPTENVPKPVATAKQVPPRRATTNPELSTVEFDDPALAEAYRRQGLTPPPRRTTDVTDWNAAIADYQAKQNPKPVPTVSVSNTSDALQSAVAFLGAVTDASADQTPRGVAGQADDHEDDADGVDVEAVFGAVGDDKCLGKGCQDRELKSNSRQMAVAASRCLGIGRFCSRPYSTGRGSAVRGHWPSERIDHLLHILGRGRDTRGQA